ncbi:MAG: hypothetical protein O3B31_05180 [Chloroflexi bacterium]|nr:hypothetical protein [Chloroflexota bacterium]MDA1002728.1 hypothetical protein [Chloroflexota bacterium]
MRKITGKPWFGPGRWLGWGSTPSTWQGWLVTLIVIVVLLFARSLIDSQLVWLIAVAVILGAYYVVIRLTGAPPERRERRPPGAR